MNRFSEIKGMAIVIVMGIIAISGIMITLVFYFMEKGTEVSLLDKKYQTAKEASNGAVEVFVKEIIAKSISGTALSTTVSGFSTTITGASVTKPSTTANSCFTCKLTKSTSSWISDSTCGCTTDNTSSNPKTSADVKFSLAGTSGQQTFDVYVKITDTVTGNTNTTGVSLEGGGTADSASGLITAQHFPYMYKIDIQGEGQLNPSERTNIEVLYAY